MLMLDMSRFISDLLAKEKAAIRTTLERLELASGEKSNDARLISEIVVQSKAKIKQLGLDSEDTTPAELYSSLINLAELHDVFLTKALGGNESSEVSEMLTKITKFANSVAKTKTAWAIKHAVAKRQLKELPPKALMKTLGYRSIDSMLKRENIDDLFAGIRVIESIEYINKFLGSFKKLSPSDFESRKMEVRQLNQKKWQKATKHYVSKTKNNIIGLKELGSVVVLPLPIDKLKGLTIALLPLVLYKLNDVHMYSSYFKFEQVQHDFGDIFSKSLLDKPQSNANMAGLDLSWNIIRDHFGKLAKSGMTDIFEPHIQIDDLEKQIVEESLYKLEPALHFWFGNEILGLPYKEGVISFNLLDVATNYINRLDFGNNCTKYLSESLWNELMKRYLSEEPLQDQVLQQLDSQSMEDEFDGQSISGTAFA